VAKNNQRKRLNGSLRGVRIFLLVAAVLISVSVLYVSRNQPLPEGTLEIRFLDVGQGDASFLVTEDGCALIDTGESSARQSVYFAVNSYGNRLEYLIVTHPHTDHMGGAAYILNKMEVGTVVLPRAASWDDEYTRLLDAVRDSGAAVLYADPGLEFSLGEASFRVLAPTQSYENVNDTSAVIRVDFGRVSALFTGDAEETSERDQLARYGSFPGSRLDADILKVGHHGSSTSSSEAYLRAVSPRWAVISCGKDNTYGHPAADVVSRLQALGAEVLRTDKRGTITIVTDGETVTIKEQ